MELPALVLALLLVVALVWLLPGDLAAAAAESGGGHPAGSIRAAVLLGIGAASAVAVALGLPGLHQVLEQDWRLAAGVAVAAVLVGCGAALEGRIGWVGSGLIGAGLALLLPCLCLAAELGLLSRPIAFGAIGLGVAAALVASLRAGQAVAPVGLVAGLLAPYWGHRESIYLADRDPLALDYVLLLFGALLPGQRRIPVWLGCGAGFACARGAVGSLTFARGGPAATAWWLTGMTAVALLTLARRAPSRASLGWVWVAAGAAAGLADGAGVPAGAKVGALGMAVVAGFVAVSGLALWRTPLAARWPAAVAGVSGAYFLVGLPAERQGAGAAWGALGLAALNLALVALARRLLGREEGRAASAVPLTVALGSLGVAVPLAVGMGLYEVGGALVAAAWAWAAARFGLRQLSPAAMAAAVWVVLAAGWDLSRFLALQGPGARALQLYAYGVPLVVLAGAAAATWGRGQRWLTWVLAWSATALGFLLVRLTTTLTTPYLQALLLLAAGWPLAARWMARRRVRPQAVR